MKTLELSSGDLVLIDDDVYDWAVAYRWGRLGGRPGHPYVGRIENNRVFYLHRLVIGATHGEIVDHVDGDRLNNQRVNLRLVSPSENQQNRRAAKSNSTTGLRGVQFMGASNLSKPYRAVVIVDRKRHLFGYFATAQEAGEAAAIARKELHPRSPEAEGRTS